nr:hypothetical protein [Campylobacter jejuni]
MKLEENSQFGFMLDQSKCVGCRTCSLSCKDYKNMPVGINFRRVFETEGGGEYVYRLQSLCYGMSLWRTSI